MRIAFVDFILDPARPGKNGLSDLVWDMATRLARLGDDVHVVGPYTVDVDADQGVQVHRFPLPPIGYQNIIGHSWIILRAYRELLKLGKLDVIHTPEYHSAAMIASLCRDTPLVFTEPGNIYERLANGNPYDPATTQVYKLAARFAARRCAQLIATSEWMKEWWHRTGVPLDKITLIPLGVDTAVFRPIAGARQALGLSNDTRILLCATRLSRENGVDLVLKAAAQLLPEVPDCQLHVVGDGPERESLLSLAESLGVSHRTVWHGWVDFAQLPLFYSAADAFAFAGRSGGTPRVLLQAMACGAAVVASRIGGIVDHVTHRQTGLLFSSGSAEQLAIEASRVLGDPLLRATLGHNASEYVNSTVDWDILVQRVRKVYSKVTGGSE